MKGRLVAVLVLVFTASSALAVQPGEMLADPALEARARAISEGLRCLVCQNQSIDDSNADLARDLRLLVRERLRRGDSDQAVNDHLVQRYGDYVLLRPPFKAITWLLWIGPFVILGLGGLATLFYLRGRRGMAAAADTQPLSLEERRRLDALLDGEGLDGEGK